MIYSPAMILPTGEWRPGIVDNYEPTEYLKHIYKLLYITTVATWLIRLGSENFQVPNTLVCSRLVVDACKTLAKWNNVRKSFRESPNRFYYGEQIPLYTTFAGAPHPNENSSSDASNPLSLP